MLTGYVVGRATSTVKHEALRGAKLLIIQPCLAGGVGPDGDPVLAVDQIGAGKGDRVILTSDGKYSRELLRADATPVRWSVIGIQDPDIVPSSDERHKSPQSKPA
jgi:ethanolamine utilization protein EutN